MKKTFSFFIIAAIIGSGFYFAYKKNWIPQSIKDQVDKDAWQKISKDMKEQGGVLASKSAEAKTHLSQVLGESTDESDSTKAPHEKALEYGRYLYCKQVVEDYEKTD